MLVSELVVVFVWVRVKQWIVANFCLCPVEPVVPFCVPFSFPPCDGVRKSVVHGKVIGFVMPFDVVRDSAGRSSGSEVEGIRVGGSGVFPVNSGWDWVDGCGWAGWVGSVAAAGSLVVGKGKCSAL